MARQAGDDQHLRLGVRTDVGLGEAHERCKGGRTTTSSVTSTSTPSDITECTPKSRRAWVSCSTSRNLCCGRRRPARVGPVQELGDSTQGAGLDLDRPPLQVSGSAANLVSLVQHVGLFGDGGGRPRERLSVAIHRCS